MEQATHYRLFLAFILLIGALFSNLRAQGDTLLVQTVVDTMKIAPIEPDRPSHADAASLTAKGYFQMENGFNIIDTDPGFLYYYPSTIWKYGVNSNFELRVITEYINIQHEGVPDVDGLLPIQVGFKAKLLDQHGIVPKAAVLGHLSLPGVASDQFQTTYFAPSFSLAFQHVISDRFNVFYDVAVKWDGEDPRPTFLYAIGTGAHLFAGLGIYIEAFGDLPQQLEDEYHHRLDGGLTYLIGNNVMVDASGGIGLSDNAPEQYVSVGISYRFNLLGK